MAVYYVELSGGDIQPNASLSGGGISVANTLAGGDIHPGGSGGGASLVSTSVSYTPTAAGISDTLTPPAGYDGFDQVGVTVTGDADLVAGNIKNGVTIFGITGSYSGGGASLVSTSVSYTPSETAISATLTPPTGYDGFDQVGVSVGAISSTYVGSGITQRTSSDLSASGATVTAPSGYYASSASKTIASAPTPTLNMNSVSASGTLDVNVDFASGGYVSAGTINLTESGAFSVQAAQTIHPSTSDQTISADKYLTGAQTIKGVLLTNLTASNIKKDVVVEVGDSADPDRILSITGTYEGGGGGVDDPTDFSGGNIMAIVGHGTEYINTTYCPSQNVVCGTKLADSNTTQYEHYWSFCNSTNYVGLQRYNQTNQITVKQNGAQISLSFAGFGSKAVTPVFSTLGTTVRTATKPLLFFRGYYNNNIESQISAYTFYGLNILNSNFEYVARFLPWLDNGEACIKEIISGTIYKNAGTGAFDYIDLEGVLHSA